jgi:hypothetical protein
MGNLNLYEKIIGLFLLFNIIYYPINEDYLNFIIPKDFCSYMYWLSIGLFLGFKLYKYEIGRNDQQNKP